MYEHRRQQPLSRRAFRRRVARHLAVACLIAAGSLAAGIAGYVWFERLSVLDAFLDAAMLLGGMGPVHTPVTAGGKLFAGLYALYAGVVFLVVAAIIVAPVVHRVLHRFHWEDRG
jgi:hypothetical protein